jgi:hypothetical protein
MHYTGYRKIMYCKCYLFYCWPDFYANWAPACLAILVNWKQLPVIGWKMVQDNKGEISYITNPLTGN